MRIYSNCYQLMSETGRNLWEMGDEVKPKTYQNKIIEGNDDFITKELICEQFCLTSLEGVEHLFTFDKRSREWTDAEFTERITPPTKSVNRVYYVNPGTAWKIRKDLWEDFLVPMPKLPGEVVDNHRFDYTYNERIMNMQFNIDKLAYNKPALISIIELLSNDPDTRKAVLPIFDSKDVPNNNGGMRIPCSMYYDFLIREVKGVPQLNICYHQRSADFVSHFGNDVYLAWKLMSFVASQVGVKPGYLYHTIDSLHAYKKDWSKLKTSLNEL